VGVATLGPGTSEAAALVATADVALYAAKRQGRNLAVHADGPPEGRARPGD
jgi:PleD family two-component response regulator